MNRVKLAMFSLLTILSHVVWMGFASYGQIKIDGDFVLGGLFPVHEQGEHGSPCGQLSEGRGIHRVEAMLFALEQINKDPVLLPGIQLGARIFDSCSNPTHALNLSLMFVRELMGAEMRHYRCSDGSLPSLTSSTQPVAGVIGGSYSGVSVQTAHLLRLFEIVQISPASTNADLSDKTRFDFFARTVPSDIYQARAMAAVARRYNWTYISLVYSSGEYGEALAEDFKFQARQLDICVAVEEKMSKRGQARYIVDRLMNAVIRPDRGPRVVLLFTRNDDTRAILQQASMANRRNKQTQKLQWIAADGWEIGPVTTSGWEDAAEDAIVITLEAQRVLDFEKHLFSLHPNNPLSLRNEWFHEFWELKFNCSLKPDTRRIAPIENDPESDFTISTHKPRCRSSQRLGIQEMQVDDKVPFVIDAVYALAYALHEMWREYCLGVAGVCPALKKINGRRLYQNYLLNVTFRGLVDNQFRFDANGDGPANYRFKNYQLVDEKLGKYSYVDVGRWRQGALMIEDEKMSWVASPSGSGRPPLSICTPACPVGHRKELMQKGETCCWACIPCSSHQFMTDELTCVDCPDGHWPNEDRRECFPLPIEHMQWDSPYSIVANSLASVGILLTLQVIIIYAKFWSTPVIKASGRELSCVFLSGVLLCFCTTYIVLAKPSRLVCGLRRVSVSLGFAVLYSATLVKTNRIYRIFLNAQLAKRCRFISPASQLVIAGLLISVELLGSLVWLAIEPPSIKLVYPSRNQVVSKCAQEDHWFLVSLSYDTILIILCTVFAVKTRLVPENFNEAKFIGFTMYTTCIIWVAFLPLYVYFGTEGDFKIQLTTLSVCVTLSAMVALICLYGPKLWIVLFEPEKNVRRPTSTSTTLATHWAMLLPDPSVYTPLLALRPVPGVQNVFLAPPTLADMFRERERRRSSNNETSGPVENGTKVMVHSNEHTSEIVTDSYS